MKKYTQEEADLIRPYVESGKSSKYISEVFGTSERRVQNIRERFEIYPAPGLSFRKKATHE